MDYLVAIGLGGCQRNLGLVILDLCLGAGVMRLASIQDEPYIALT